MNTPKGTTTNGYPNPKANRAVYEGPTGDFVNTDWRDLALACIDQAGVRASTYGKIEALLAEVEDTQPTGT